MEDKRIERWTNTPQSFEQQMEPNYLGSPTVVLGILERFVAEIFGWVRLRAANTLSASEMTEQAHERAPDFARIFAGEDPAYQPIVGWNTRVGGLQETIKVDLGHYWQSQRARHGEDPYQVLYAWLVWAVVDALKGDDEDLGNATVGQRLQQLVRLLTGSTARKGV